MSEKENAADGRKSAEVGSVGHVTFPVVSFELDPACSGQNRNFSVEFIEFRRLGGPGTTGWFRECIVFNFLGVFLMGSVEQDFSGSVFRRVVVAGENHLEALYPGFSGLQARNPLYIFF